MMIQMTDEMLTLVTCTPGLFHTPTPLVSFTLCLFWWKRGEFRTMVEDTSVVPIQLQCGLWGSIERGHKYSENLGNLAYFHGTSWRTLVRCLVM